MKGGRRAHPNGESTMSRSVDEGLLERIASGDATAFSALYDRYADLVYGVARRILRSPEQAQDVTQSVFLKVWSRPQLFTGGSFGAWAARVARNASLDVVRSSAVRLREPEIPATLAAAGELEETVFADVDREIIVRAVAGLPEAERVVIEQAYFGGLTYRQVAERLDTPLGTVKTRIRAGLQRLRGALQEAVTR
ncbi:sigma-70 family RNA polymerase sigma factor [bacterium]|nr:MAG: sigma-70 family RNA polymerase sigma factor [bacterium]